MQTFRATIRQTSEFTLPPIIKRRWRLLWLIPLWFKIQNPKKGAYSFRAVKDSIIEHYGPCRVIEQKYYEHVVKRQAMWGGLILLTLGTVLIGSIVLLVKTIWYW